MTGLPEGRVEVTVVTATLPAGLTPTYDLDGGLDDTAVRVLAAGEVATDVDFGYAGRRTPTGTRCASSPAPWSRRRVWTRR